MRQSKPSVQRSILFVAPCVCMLLLIPSLAGGQALAPRVPLQAEPVRALPLPQAEGFPAIAFPYRLIVKFADGAIARATADGSLQFRGTAPDGREGETVAQLVRAHELTFSPLIRLPEAKLRAFEARAAVGSGRAQPDLAAWMIVHLGAPTARQLERVGEALQALAVVEIAAIQILGEPPPLDIAPPTPDHVALQGYRGPDPGIDADYAATRGATGTGIRLADCEYGWTATHEDLEDRNLNLEPGQTIAQGVFDNGWDQHGTAVLGETSGVANAYGVTGMVPDATVHTYPEWTNEEDFRRVTAITNAIADSAAGDVVLLEMQASGAGGGFGPAELDAAVWTVVKAGTDAGVIVVGAAGNGNQNLDAAAYQSYRDRGDSGAIIVGAGSPNTSHNKLSFSTYGDRVNVQGWGSSVFTLGYGGFAQYGGDLNQAYTSTFSGTSSASPFVTAAAVAIQSHVETITGSRLSPADMRALLIDTGIPQGSGGNIGPFPDLRAAIERVDATFPFFADGFESGDLSAWSSSVP